MRVLITLAFILQTAAPVAAATIWITGFEHGGLPPTANIGEPDVMIYGVGSTPQQLVTRSGGWALQQGVSFSRVFLDTLGPSVATIACRVWVKFSPTASPNSSIFFSTATTTLYAVIWNGTNMQITNGGAGFTTTTGTAVVASGVWTRIDVAYDTADGGVGKLWVNGVLDINITHTGAQTNVTRFSLSGEATTGGYFYDDIHCNNTLTPPPDGRVITRRPIAGSPVDTGFTLSGCATIEECWAETPWSATKSANSGSTTSAVAQTAIVSPFSQTQAGLGTTIIPAGATINAVQVQAIAKTSNTTSGGDAGNIRYRVNGGAAVDLPITFITTVDRGWPQAGSGFFTDTPANLDHYEIGWLKSASALARLHTVEDMWMTVDFTAPILQIKTTNSKLFSITTGTGALQTKQP